MLHKNHWEIFQCHVSVGEFLPVGADERADLAAAAAAAQRTDAASRQGQRHRGEQIGKHKLRSRIGSKRLSRRHQTHGCQVGIFSAKFEHFGTF